MDKSIQLDNIPTGFGITDAIAAVRRSLIVIALIIITFLLLAMAYLYLAEPRYVASAEMMMSSQRQPFQIQGINAETQIDPLTVESHVELIKSDTIARAVVQKLKLDSQLSASKPDEGFLAKVASNLTVIFASGENLLPPDETRAAIAWIQSNLTARRVGLTYIIEVSFRDKSPEVAARIANEITNTYIEDQIRSTYDAADRLNAWLAARAQDLREEALNAERAVESYRGEDRVALRALESSAAAARSTYDIFQRRLMEAGQSGSLPVTEARLISPALPPLSKSILRIPAVLGAALLFGTMVGVGVALIRGRLDTSFRSDAQVERFLTKCIGVIPRLKFGGRHRKTTGGAQMLRFAVDHPFSEFREALRAATVAVDGYCRKGPCKVVAVLSTHPGEGATTVAGNFASQLASVGFKTLLIDADLRDFSLTRLLSNEAKPSLVDILGNLTADGEACQLSSLPGVSFLAFAANDPSQFMPEVLASAEMHRFLDLARQNYSYVVLDLPPLGSFVDASTVASAVDQFILVVEWGRVPRQQVMKALQKSPLVANKLVGVLLNKVPLRLI